MGIPQYNSVDMIGEISHEKHNNMQDHDTLVIDTNYDSTNEDEEPKINFCSTKIPLYKRDNMDIEQISKAKEYL